MRFILRIRRLFIDSFGFSKTEANGFVILFIFIVLIGIVPRAYLNSNSGGIDKYEDEKALHEWAEQLENSISIKEKKKKKELVKVAELRTFDPNSATIEQLEMGGLPKFLAQRIIKYRNKGGVYKMNEDLNKMYGMTDSIYMVIRPYIRIKEVKTNSQDFFTFESKEIPITTFDLNTATTEELQQIRGIGPVLSERIVKYRDLLGGFKSIVQLSEVYGLKEEVINELILHSELSIELSQLTINTDSIRLLTKHPYINFNLARAIINYREVHGEYKDLIELMNIKVMNDSLYQKLSPYLSL